CLFFFFQAEDGIRDFHVTGVQTCALPICPRAGEGIETATPSPSQRSALGPSLSHSAGEGLSRWAAAACLTIALTIAGPSPVSARSEERRVGKEWKGRMSWVHCKEIEGVTR